MLSFLVEDLVVKTYVPLCLSLVIWLGGLAGIVAMYSLKSFKNRRVTVLYLVGAVYLAYVAVMAYDFAIMVSTPLSPHSTLCLPLLTPPGIQCERWGFIFAGPGSWIIRMMFYDLPPLISLTFMSLPTLLNLEILGCTAMIYFVIVPLLSPRRNVWLDLQTDNVLENVERLSPVPLAHCAEGEK